MPEESSRDRGEAHLHTSPDFYLFGRFRLSADGTLLLRNGVVVPLPPKVLQTLLVLVQRAGTVVTKADLMERIWPDSFVEDTGLTRNMSALRQALGDEHQHRIATVARVGYRFAVQCNESPEVQVLPRTAKSGTADKSPSDALANSMRCATHSNALRDGQGGIVALAGEPGI